MTTEKLIEFAKIDDSPARDARARLRDELVEEYADAILGDVNLGRGVLFFDGRKYWLGDGKHRMTAAIKRGLKADQYEIKEGGYDEAFRFACRANDTHGGRTSNEDKRARCEAYWRRHAGDDPRPSDRSVALACNVSHALAGNVRRELEESGALETVSNAQASDGRTYPSRRRKSEAEASVALDGETVAIPPATTPVAVPDRVLGRMVADAADEFEERHGTGGSADDPEPWPGDDEEQDDLDEEVFVAGYEDEPAGDDAPAAPAFDDAPFDALFGKLVRFFDARANALGQTKSGHYRRTIDGMNDVARRFRSWQEVGK